jgi:hypothetical protein
MITQLFLQRVQNLAQQAVSNPSDVFPGCVNHTKLTFARANLEDSIHIFDVGHRVPEGL